MPIERGLRTERIAVNCYAEAFERIQGIIPSKSNGITVDSSPLYLSRPKLHL